MCKNYLIVKSSNKQMKNKGNKWKIKISYWLLKSSKIFVLYTVNLIPHYSL